MSKKRNKKSTTSETPAARSPRNARAEKPVEDLQAAVEAVAPETIAAEAPAAEAVAAESFESSAPAVETAVEEVAAPAAPKAPALPPIELRPHPPMPDGAYALLADFDRRSLAHDPGVPEQIEAPGLWRGIGFRVGDHRFVSGIDEISEILMAPPPVTSIPSTRPWLLGVSNVRGNLIALVDLKQFLFEKRTHVTPRARVLVVRQNGGNVGLLVDELLGQRNLTDADRAGSEGEADPNLARFVTENVTLGAARVGRFSMVDLTHAPEFAHAAT